MKWSHLSGVRAVANAIAVRVDEKAGQLQHAIPRNANWSEERRQQRVSGEREPPAQWTLPIGLQLK